MTRRTSSLVLILANLIPLAGVFLFQWDLLAILLLYWAESVIIGVLNVVRMVCCKSDNVLHGMLPLCLVRGWSCGSAARGRCC